MINHIKNWWNNDEHCFAKNPLFWLLTAGACAAAPFTGFLSLAAIPVFAGLAEKGYLPYERASAGFQWLFSGNSMDKSQTIPQDEHDDRLDNDERNLSSSSHSSIAEQIMSIPDGATIEEGALVLYQGIPSLGEEYADIQEALSDLAEEPSALSETSKNQRWVQLADEAVLLLEWLYRYRVKLNLNHEEIAEIYHVLKKIPEKQRPSHYPEEEKAHFLIGPKLGKLGVFFDDDRFDDIMHSSGRKIGARFLLRFHEDKTNLPPDDKTNSIPFRTSRQLVQGLTLQSVCQMLNRMLSNVFIQKKKDIDTNNSQSTARQFSPAFWEKYRQLESKIERYTQYFQEISRQARANIEKKKKHIAEMDVRHEENKRKTAEIKEQNLALWIEKINEDDESFSDTRETLLGYGYPLKAKGVKRLIAPEGHLEKVRDKLIQAIIQNDKQLKLTRICFETPENPNGFITPADIYRLFSEEKASKILQKLTSPPQTSSNLFSFLPSLPSLTKSHSGSSQSSKGTSSDEETKESEAEHGKKKVTTVVQETFSI